MPRAPFGLLVALTLSLCAQSALAQTTVSVTVGGNQGPWRQSVNPAFAFGFGDAAPVLVSAADGIPFVPGGTITVTYVSGLVSACHACPAVDANGDLTAPVNDNPVPACDNSYCPSYYMSPYPIYVVELVGTFANEGVIVGTPFAIGDGPSSFTIPSGANQLLLGVNDCDLANGSGDNEGSFTLQISASAPPTGNLEVDITGLGTDASVDVRSSNGFSVHLNSTTTLTDLTPGIYTIAAAIVADGTDSTLAHVPLVSGSPAIVISGTIAVAAVPYSTLSTVWQPIGPSAIGGSSSGMSAAGKLQAFAISATNPLLMYTGGGIGPGNSGPYTEAGVYKTMDGGTNWTQVNTGLTDPTINALWADPTNDSTVLAGTHFTGIFQSLDGGGTWNLAGSLGSTAAFLQIGASLYAATAQGIAQSDDDGATWNIVRATTVPVRTLAANAGAIYAGLEDASVLMRPASSQTWTASCPTTTCPGSSTVWSIAVNPDNPQNAFVVEWRGYQTPDLYVSQNGGSQWTVSNAPNCAVQVVAFDPVTAQLYAGCDGSLWQSADGGSSWSPLPDVASLDVRLIVPGGSGAGNIVVGTDQGLYVTWDAGSTWQSLNGNITSSILFGLGVSDTTILATAQDFSPIYTFDNGTTWVNLQQGPSGESGSVLFNPLRPEYAYVFTTAGFQYSIDGGQTFRFAPELPSTSFNQGSGNGDLIAVDVSSPSTVYVAALDGVYQSLDWGVSWTRRPWDISSPVMVAVDPSDSSTIFVGSQNGVLWITHDGGTTWNGTVLSGIACGSPVTLIVDPSDSHSVLVGMSMPSACGGVLQSRDGGVSFTRTLAVSDRQTSCQTAALPHLKADLSVSGLVAASTQGGLYLSSDFGTYWVNISGNAVPFAFTDEAWWGGQLYASTCGEGVLTMTFPF